MTVMLPPLDVTTGAQLAHACTEVLLMRLSTSKVTCARHTATHTGLLHDLGPSTTAV